MIAFESMQSLIRCPRCWSSALTVLEAGTHLVCGSCGSRYPLSSGRPVLLRPDNEVFSQKDYLDATVRCSDENDGIWQRCIPKSSVNLASLRVLSRVRELLSKMPSATVLVVGAGCQRKWLDERLGSGGSVQTVYTDIDVAAGVDLFCDGHDLPFVDGTFDAVVTTAVLEHVLYPERVAAEITRVLKEGGLLYSELPFMQQVHEGAYDFTRYTMSGHRRLFNHIVEIDSGMVAGPATALVWALENFVLAFVVRPPLRKIAKAIVRLTFAWIKYFDLLLAGKPAAMDGASCTYLLGSKIDERIPDRDMIARYVGAKRLRHT